MTNANPSQNPADLGTLGGTLRWAFKKLMQSTDGMLPATVIAVDDKREFATVQPLIHVLATDNSLTPRAQVARVPILTVGAGNYVLSFPVKAGDLGWILASDRDISLYVQSNAAAGPNSNRLHSFEDGLFVPDKARQWTLDGGDTDRVVLQSLDGTEKITIGTASIKLLHPTLIEFDAPSVTMTGDLTVDGTITGQTDVVADTVSGKTHVHSGVTAGSSEFGAAGTMTQALACDANYDLYLGPDGHIAIARDLAAVEQNCRSALSVRLGECVLNLTRGMPFFGAAFLTPNEAQYEAAGRTLLLTIADVTAVKSFIVTRRDSTFGYVAKISTPYGDGEING